MEEVAEADVVGAVVLNSVIKIWVSILNLAFSPFKLSHEELKKIDEIHKLKEEFPSLRVVGRGTIVIDPKEIINSPKFQEDRRKASEMIRQLNERNR